MSNFTVTNGNVPILIHIPHGGTLYPQYENMDWAMGFAEAQQEIYTMADLFTDKLGLDVIKTLHSTSPNYTPFTLINHYSRLYFDPERFNDETEEMNAVGMGVIYSKGSQQQDLYDTLLSAAEKDNRIEAYTLYHETFKQVVTDILHQYGKVFILDLHSYATHALPYELHKTDLRPQICVGYDDQNNTPKQIENIVSTLQENYEIASNQPFWGSIVPLDYIGMNNVESVMLEIRKDMYLSNNLLNLDKYDRLVECISRLLLQI